VPAEYQSKFNNVNDYNDWVASEMFMDPYTVPPIISREMNELAKLIMEYCFTDYLSPDSIAKLNHNKRNTILLVDTDSNVINANLFIRFILDEILPGQTFNRKRLYNDMICANILASILARCVEVLLERYGVVHNADESARKELSMKNEFFFRRFFLMNTKKRYATSIALREGHIVYPFKTEIKGLDFIKAGVTDDVTEKFTTILENHVLFSEELELHNMMREIRRFEKEIQLSLQNGGVEYLKTMSYKTERAYKNPWQTQVFKAVMVWNMIVPEQKIYSLNKVKLAKLIVNDESDLEAIRSTHPQIHRAILDNVFHAKAHQFYPPGGLSNNPETRQKEEEKAAADATAMIKSGMKAIAIPASVTQIPDWIRPLIDYQTIMADICNSFRSVLDSFRIDEIPLKTPNGRANITTGLISI
jgi:hypothetical protein